MKYLDLISAAYRLRNVIDENDPPSPEQAKTALRTLNQMCAVWKAKGIDIQYFPTNTLTDTLTVPDWAEQGVLGQLAIRLTAGSPISESLALLAREGLDVIRSKTIGAEMGVPIDTENLPAAEAQRRHGGFYNG